jgi:hypothetical protein
MDMLFFSTEMGFVPSIAFLLKKINLNQTSTNEIPIPRQFDTIKLGLSITWIL